MLIDCHYSHSRCDKVIHLEVQQRQAEGSLIYPGSDARIFSCGRPDKKWILDSRSLWDLNMALVRRDCMGGGALISSKGCMTWLRMQATRGAFWVSLTYLALATSYLSLCFSVVFMWAALPPCVLFPMMLFLITGWETVYHASELWAERKNIPLPV